MMKVQGFRALIVPTALALTSPVGNRLFPQFLVLCSHTVIVTYRTSGEFARTMGLNFSVNFTIKF